MESKMYIRDLKAWKKNITKLEAERDAMTKEIDDAKQEMKDACHHPQQYVKTREEYTPGGYLDTDYTDYTPYCELCDAEGITETKHHGNYG